MAAATAVAPGPIILRPPDLVEFPKTDSRARTPALPTPAGTMTAGTELSSDPRQLAALGECPVWDHRTNTLYWIDIIGDRVLSTRWLDVAQQVEVFSGEHLARDSSGSCVSHSALNDNHQPLPEVKLPVGEGVGFVALTSDPNLLLGGGARGLFLVNVLTGKLTARHSAGCALPGFTAQGLLGQPATAATAAAEAQKGVPRARRFNDSKVDPAGRLIAGVMQHRRFASDMRSKASGESVLFFAGLPPPKKTSGGGASTGGSDEMPKSRAPDGLPRMRWSRGFGLAELPALRGSTVPNGLAFSPSGRKLYFVDTPRRAIAVFDYDIATGSVDGLRPQRLGAWASTQQRRNSAGNSQHGGVGRAKILYEAGDDLDGMTVDANGDIWVAVLRKGEVRHICHRTGAHVATLPLPRANLATSVAFAGPGLRWLVVTTAQGTTPEVAAKVGGREAQQRRTDPSPTAMASGSLFIADVGVGGTMSVPFSMPVAAPWRSVPTSTGEPLLASKL